VCVRAHGASASLAAPLLAHRTHCGGRHVRRGSYTRRCSRRAATATSLWASEPPPRKCAQSVVVCPRGAPVTRDCALCGAKRASKITHTARCARATVAYSAVAPAMSPAFSMYVATMSGRARVNPDTPTQAAKHARHSAPANASTPMPAPPMKVLHASHIRQERHTFHTQSAHLNTHTHTHTYKHTRTHAHIHTHIYTEDTTRSTRTCPSSTCRAPTPDPRRSCPCIPAPPRHAAYPPPPHGGQKAQLLRTQVHPRAACATSAPSCRPLSVQISLCRRAGRGGGGEWGAGERTAEPCQRQLRGGAPSNAARCSGARSALETRESNESDSK
jgi:hypothetical protein